MPSHNTIGTDDSVNSYVGPLACCELCRRECPHCIADLQNVLGSLADDPPDLPGFVPWSPPVPAPVVTPQPYEQIGSPPALGSLPSPYKPGITPPGVTKVAYESANENSPFNSPN